VRARDKENPLSFQNGGKIEPPKAEREW